MKIQQQIASFEQKIVALGRVADKLNQDLVKLKAKTDKPDPVQSKKKQRQQQFTEYYLKKGII